MSEAGVEKVRSDEPGAGGVGDQDAFASTAAEQAAPPARQRSFVERVLGVLRLDASVYGEIAGDPGALSQAVGVVAAAAATRALAAEGGALGGQGVAFAIQVGLLWLLVSGLVWGVGAWFRHPAGIGRVAAVMGFAMAPLVLGVFALIPVELVAMAVGLISTALLLATFFFGVRHALQVDASRAALVSLVVVLSIVFLFMVVSYLTGAPA